MFRPAKRVFRQSRWSPSAVNTQPWRLLWRNGELTLFVTRHNPRYHDENGQTYRLYDGGICMANLAISLREAGLQYAWRLYTENENITDTPQNMQPLASLSVSSWRSNAG
jgi:nitroreductase